VSEVHLPEELHIAECPAHRADNAREARFGQLGKVVRVAPCIYDPELSAPVIELIPTATAGSLYLDAKARVMVHLSNRIGEVIEAANRTGDRYLGHIDQLAEAKSERGIFAQVLCGSHQCDVLAELYTVLAILQYSPVDTRTLEQLFAACTARYRELEQRTRSSGYDRQLRHRFCSPCNVGSCSCYVKSCPPVSPARKVFDGGDMNHLFLAIVITGMTVMPMTAHTQCATTVQQLLTERKLDEARAEVDALLKRSPRDDAAMDCMGRVLLEKREPGEAAEWLEKATKINPQSAQHFLWLAKALGAEGEKASKLRQPFIIRRFKAANERALALDPTLVDARRNLVMFYSMAPGFMGGDMNKAKLQAAEIMKLNPMRGHTASGVIAERSGDKVTAEKEFLVAIAIAPDSAGAYHSTALFYVRQNRKREAIAMYERTVALDPNNEDVKKAFASLTRE
jgi:tetratricopeptide (TPR) repeat protein